MTNKEISFLLKQISSGIKTAGKIKSQNDKVLLFLGLSRQAIELQAQIEATPESYTRQELLSEIVLLRKILSKKLSRLVGL
ncbi:MAG: hypothetical protein PHU54_02425 [Candidatus Omnitrophica bacterium]|nr:hypothetical protein [Candidatus Omnitrophota bacterium]